MHAATALKKAIALFGAKAMVEKRKCYLTDNKDKTTGNPRCSCWAHVTTCIGGATECVIGRVELGMFFAIKGYGSTWEEAFARAERDKHRDYCLKRVKNKPCRICNELSDAVAVLA